MTTINAVGNGLVGSTGAGSFVGSDSPILMGTPTTPQIGFTDNTKGIVGTLSADNANVGFVGQFVSSVVPIASGIVLTNNTAADITSISLTAGDWNVWGNVGFLVTVGSDSLSGWISSTSSTSPDRSLYSLIDMVASGALASSGFSVPQLRFNLSVTTTIYLSVVADFPSGATTGCGGIYARRVR